MVHKTSNPVTDKEGRKVYVEIKKWEESKNEHYTILETVDLQSLVCQSDCVTVHEIFLSMDPHNFHIVKSGHGLLTFMYAFCYF